MAFISTAYLYISDGRCDQAKKQTVSEPKRLPLQISSNRSVEVPCPPKRIVVCNSDVAELIIATQSPADSIVGASEYGYIRPDIKA